MTIEQRHTGIMLTALVVLLAGTSRAAAPRSVEVLLIERPASLVVYNQYQQSATPQDKARLHAFEPLVILKRNELLSDGFTQSMKVRTGNDIFYLVKERSGRFAGEKGAGSVRILSGTALPEDTVQTGNSAIPAEAAGGGTRQLAPGTVVQRLLQAGSRVYVRLVHDGSFAWISASQAGALRRYHPAVAQASGGAFRIEAQVRRKLEETNTVFRQLYGLLDRQTGHTLSAPSWTARVFPRSITCELLGAEASYTRSTQYLAKDLENSLLGTGCRIEATPGRISIQLP